MLLNEGGSGNALLVRVIGTKSDSNDTTEVVKDLPANYVLTIREGDGVVGRVPFRR